MTDFAAWFCNIEYKEIKLPRKKYPKVKQDDSPPFRHKATIKKAMSCDDYCWGGNEQWD